jgi:TPR repeat protein
MSNGDKENDGGASPGPAQEAGMDLAGFLDGGVHARRRTVAEQNWEQLLSEYLLVSSRLDHADAEARHEEIYEDATGVVANRVLRQAFDYYRQAAACGNAHAQFCAGLLHEDLDDIYDNSAEYWGDAFALDFDYDAGMAIALYEKAAAQGHAEARFRLGNAYLHGLIAPQNLEQAFHYLHSAARDGHRFAAWQLGEMYLQGKGVPQDHAKALHWLEDAAERGSQSACFALARMYGEGLGVTRDAARCDFWQNMAALADIDE